MRIIRTGFVYFAIVFAIGFVLGLARVLLMVTRRQSAASGPPKTMQKP